MAISMADDSKDVGSNRSSLFHSDIHCSLAAQGSGRPMVAAPAVVRGALKTAFRRRVWCLHPEREECGDCAAVFGCPFGVLFDPRVPPWSDRRRSETEIPSAIRIVPPEDRERASVRVILVGRAVALWPFLRAAMEHLVLGPTELPVRLLNATANGDEGEVPLVVAGRDTGKTPPLLRLPARPLQIERTVTIRFLTPLQLGHPEPRTAEEVTFLRIAKSLLGQVSSLAYFHCAQALELDFRDLVRAAGEVVSSRNRLARESGATTSSARQGHRRIPLDGWVGEIDFEGPPLSRFGSLLAAAEILGVGKKTSIGLGRLKVVDGA